MKFNADQLGRMAQALTDLADISDRAQVHVTDAFGVIHLNVDGEFVPIAQETRDDDTVTYFVEVSP